jgi:adenylyltransferase/sulfurtransferase
MNDSQLLRYSRQILLPQVDIEGQQRLLDSRALIVGLGGLGSPVALYLAAAGVGHLMISDDDQVDLSNLQRQIIHATPDISLRKTDSAARALSALNPDSAVTTLPHRLGETELYDIVGRVDVVLDCSDNFTTRFMLNRVCVRQAKPLVSAAVIRFDGQLAVFDPRRPDSPCYNCLYPDQAERAESCARNGVMAPLPGILGSLQAMEAIKLLLGIGTSPVGRLLLFDALHCEWRELRFRKDPACPTCAVV